MNSNSSSMRVVDGALDTAGGGGSSGAGGCWGSPASAETANAQTNAIARSRLFIGLPPFCGADEQDSIAPQASDPEPLFAQFWEQHTADEPRQALLTCDNLLEVIDPADLESHVRQANARAIALGDMKRYREAYAVHLAARPSLRGAGPRVVADHWHGLGLSFKWMGEHVRAHRALGAALDIYREVGEVGREAITKINLARLYAKVGSPGLAHALLDTLDTSADTQIARAMAYESEGNKAEARRSIGSALVLLADSTNEATRKEALAVLARIEGRD